MELGVSRIQIIDTVDGQNPAHQLRLVVEIPLFTGFYAHPRWLAGFLKHQQYFRVFSLKSPRTLALSSPDSLGGRQKLTEIQNCEDWKESKLRM